MAMSATLNEQILKMIEMSSSIEFALSKVNSWTRHTGIALKFDGIPTFTLDYGANENNSTPAAQILYTLAGSSQASASALNALTRGSDITFSPFGYGSSQIIKKIVKFALNSPAARKRAVDVLLKIAEITMGEYSLVSNNCRDFVDKATDVLTENEENNRRAVQQELAGIRREDAETVVAATVAAVAVVELGSALYDWWNTPTSESEQRQTQNNWW